MMVDSWTVRIRRSRGVSGLRSVVRLGMNWVR